MRKKTRHPQLQSLLKEMKKRCSPSCRPKDKPFYFDRGIRVCPEWQDGHIFDEWALANGYESGLCIDRIDNDGPYSPGNCRFVTVKENNRNRSTTKLTVEDATAIRARYQPRIVTVPMIAVEYAVSEGTIRKIISGERWV